MQSAANYRRFARASTAAPRGAPRGVPVVVSRKIATNASPSPDLFRVGLLATVLAVALTLTAGPTLTGCGEAQASQVVTTAVLTGQPNSDATPLDSRIGRDLYNLVVWVGISALYYKLLLEPNFRKLDLEKAYKRLQTDKDFGRKLVLILIASIPFKFLFDAAADIVNDLYPF